MEISLLFIIFIVGLCFGSFLNVLIHRLPQGKSITGRSLCPKCGKQISWFDNIPLLSFILLRGKCRNCKSRIFLRYPLVELFSGVIFLLLYLKFGLSSEFIFFSLISILLISIFVIDLIHQMIPDELVFAGIAISVLYFLFVPSAYTLMPRLFAGFAASVFLLLIHLATGGRGMGLGDVKFALFGGIFFGWPYCLLWLLTAFIFGGVSGSFLLIFKKANLKSKISFGPFLVLSFVFCAIFAERLLNLLYLK